MDSRRGGIHQEVPHDLAVMLRGLRAVDDPMLNVVLAVAHQKGWRTPTLAREVEMSPFAISKRIERARARGGDELERLAAAAGYAVPDLVPVRTMIDGRQLPPSKIEELKEMQQIASKVNGAMPVGHPSRRVSEEFAAELNRLVEDEGVSPYYLAGVLGVSHRAITSRLERHQMRTPCPSVAGTASGIYSGRKIGDPGQGVPRLTHQQRAELRQLWQRYEAGASDTALAGKLQEYMAAGFTLGNLAQTMSTQQARVRYGALRGVLAEADRPAEAK